MTGTPLFSIAIPTYNRAKFIVNTLESVFSQTYSHFEIIVVDNCSTDNTKEVLKDYIDEGKITFIQHERNYERARSRNTAMNKAAGDFLTLLDSDDFLYSNCLQDAADFVNSNPDIKCFHNLYELIDGNKKVVYKFDFPPIINQKKAIAKGNFMACIGNFIHRDIYSKYKFDTFSDLTGAEDWEFWLRVLATYPVGRINKINCGVLQHFDRTVQSKHFEALEKGYLYMFKKFRSDDYLAKAYDKYLDQIEASSYMYLATLANSNGYFDDAKRYLKNAVEKKTNIVFSDRFWRIFRRSVFKLATN